MPPRRPTDELVSLTAAAERLQVHYMTAYRHVRLGYLPAQQRRGRWWVRPADLQAALERPPAKAAARGRTAATGCSTASGLASLRRGRPASRRPLGGWQATARRLTRRLVAGDLAGCWGVLEAALANGASPALVYVELLGPALEAIGRGWEHGSLSVEQEHRATAVAVRLMGRMSPLFARRGRLLRGTVVLGGAPGDHHLLPVAMVADVARQQGWRVVELGANAPVASFAEAVQQAEDLVAVGVSVADTNCANAARQVLKHLRSLKPGLVTLAGGPALTDERSATNIGADLWAPDALAAASVLGHLAGPGSRRLRQGP